MILHSICQQFELLFGLLLYGRVVLLRLVIVDFYFLFFRHHFVDVVAVVVLGRQVPQFLVFVGESFNQNRLVEQVVEVESHSVAVLQ